jgi:ABC-type Fe3+ transport system permease subunit
MLALAAALASFMLAWAPAWVMARMPKLRPLILGWMILLMATPGPLLAVGLARLFNHDGFPGAIYDLTPSPNLDPVFMRESHRP